MAGVLFYNVFLPVVIGRGYLSIIRTYWYPKSFQEAAVAVSCRVGSSSKACVLTDWITSGRHRCVEST